MSISFRPSRKAALFVALASIFTAAAAEAGSRLVAGEHIVVLQANVRASDQVLPLVARHGGTVQQTWGDAINGFLVSGLDAASVEALRHLPGVRSVENNRWIDDAAPGGATGSSKPSGPGLKTAQTPVEPHLDRIDQAGYPLDTIYNYTETGSNIYIYVLDSGIRTTHDEFNTPGARSSRAGLAYDATCSGSSCAAYCDNHGTHVAGLAGGLKHGVAKGVFLRSVKVTTCNGSSSLAAIISGLDWVAANKKPKSIANLSLNLGESVAYGGSSALEDAIENVRDKNVVVVTAAGNAGVDSCKTMAGSIANILNVTSTATAGSYDEVPWGAAALNSTCAPIAAPGSYVISASAAGDSSYTAFSGTSQAAPLAAGTAALMWQRYPSMTALQVRNQVLSQGTAGVVVDPGATTPNGMKMLFTDP